MQRCPSAPSGPPSCFLPGVHQDLDTRAQRAGSPTSGRARPACVPMGILQGGGAGLATVAWASSSPWPPSSQEVSPSGGDPGQEAAAGGCVPQPPLLRKAGQKTLHSPSSWWVPSPAHSRGSGETSPSSPEPRKSNSLMASSESSSSSSSSISGTRALDGSWDTGKTTQVRGACPEPKHTGSLQTEKSRFQMEPSYTSHQLPPKPHTLVAVLPLLGAFRGCTLLGPGGVSPEPRAWVWRPLPPHLQL